MDIMRNPPWKKGNVVSGEALEIPEHAYPWLLSTPCEEYKKNNHKKCYRYMQ
jgi:hypothetical protein